MSDTRVSRGVRIYFIEMLVPDMLEHERPIKIGITQGSIKKRLSGLQTGSPYPLRILGCTKVCRYNDERQVHKRFAKLRIKGEWFRGDYSLREWIDLNKMGKSRRYPEGLYIE